MTVSIVRDPLFLAHNPGPYHPESPARLRAINKALQKATADGALSFEEIRPRPATKEEILAVHTAEHLDRIEMARGRAVSLDPDTATSEASVEAAWLAAGATVELFCQVAEGKAPPGMALVRPPGHHAPAGRAMGFCLLNNVAVGAAALLDKGLAERVAIYDWDVHHGNGTQDIFYDDPRVLYLSTHQWPFYPGTGRPQDEGRGLGEGTTLNVPLPAGTDDEALLEVVREAMVPKVRSFSPDVILISAGFDPFERDPIGGFRITVEGFTTIAKIWRDLAEEIAGGRIAGVLEGGYDEPGLGACVRATLEAWSG